MHWARGDVTVRRPVGMKQARGFGESGNSLAPGLTPGMLIHDQY